MHDRVGPGFRLLVNDVDAAALQRREGEVREQRVRAPGVFINHVSGVRQHQHRLGDQGESRLLIVHEGGMVAVPESAVSDQSLHYVVTEPPVRDCTAGERVANVEQLGHVAGVLARGEAQFPLVEIAEEVLPILGAHQQRTIDDQRGDPIGEGEGALGGRQGAGVMAQQRRPLDPKRIQHRGDHLRIVGDGRDAGCWIGQAEARHVDADRAVPARGERLIDIVELPRRHRCLVEQQQG